MTQERKRRLSAVWFADIVGYTELSSRDEDGALAVVDELQRIAREEVEAGGGRIVKFQGDAVLATFDSTAAALTAAIALRDAFCSSEIVLEKKCTLRIGVHVGDVVQAPDGDVYGDGVNVASRIEGAAPPGQVLVSEDVYRQVRQRGEHDLRPFGPVALKGVSGTLELYSVGEVSKPAPLQPAAHSSLRARAIGVGIAAGIGAFLLLSVTIANSLTDPTSTASMPALEERQLTFNGFVLEGALAPAGDFFAYVTREDAWQRLYLQDVAGNNPILLDSLQTLLCCMVWSPDGTQIAYQRGTRADGVTVVTPRLGGPRRQIAAEVALAWSSDGARLLSWWPAAKQLSITDLETGALVDSIPLGDEFAWVHAADWSPRGDRVVVALANNRGLRVIRTLELDGSIIEDLIATPTLVTSPRWGQEGSWIYYRTPDEIWRVPVALDGHNRGDPVRLLSGVENGVFNRVTPSIQLAANGGRLLHVRAAGHSNMWSFEVPGSPGAGGREPRRLTRGTAERTTPRLSPDGRTLAYIESVGGLANLYVTPIEGGTARQLTFFEGGVWSPAWSPDGSTIAFGSQEGGEAALWLVDLDGGAVRNAGVEGFSGNQITWAPGRDIVYQTHNQLELGVINPRTWAQRDHITAQPGTWWYDPWVSPDGTTLAVRRLGDQQEGLWLVDLIDGGEKFLSEVNTPIGWSTDGEFVFAMAGLLAGTARDVYRISIRDGERDLYMTLPPSQGAVARQVAISADGRTLVAAVPTHSTDMWLVDGIDPHNR